jgi:hypothetical protein
MDEVAQKYPNFGPSFVFFASCLIFFLHVQISGASLGSQGL